MEMKNGYRFDDAYEKVYRLDAGAYIFRGSYLAYGINSNMTDEEKTLEVEEQDLME